MFHAEFELTNHCNTRCLHCPHEAMTRRKGRLSRATFDTVVEKIRDFCRGERYSLSFSGMGEPLLHPELFDFVRAVSHEACTSFATNGAALTETNVRRLIDAGLDQIYLSFNGDDRETYARMMGGLSLDRAERHLATALALAAGTRLRISANISVTKANRHQLTALTRRLKNAGVKHLSYAMAHTRGGNLRDPDVVDTPPLPTEVTRCDVLANTLFIDWRGKVFICDHDLHGEHTLGDLTQESLACIQERRQRLIDNGVHFKLCTECRDVLKMGTDLFADLRSGTLRDWVYEVYRDDAEGEPILPDATPNQTWLYTLCEKEGRVNRMVNGLLRRNQVMETALSAERGMLEDARAGFAEALSTVEKLNIQARGLAARVQELDRLALEREQRIRELDAERRAWRALVSWRLARCERAVRRAWPRIRDALFGDPARPTSETGAP